MWGYIAVVVYLLSLTVVAEAQSTSPDKSATTAQRKEIRIAKISHRPSLEDFLDGSVHSDMTRIDDFRQRQPGDGTPVSRRTSAWIGYDDANLYVFFLCDSPLDRTRARLAKREDILSDDFVGIFLDTYHDRQRSYSFLVNPLGIQADAVTSEGQEDDFNFDTLWYSEGRLTTFGFAVSITIPFKSLRFSSTDLQIWGLGLVRSIPDVNEQSFWPFVTQKVQGFNQQLATATGIQDISPGRNIWLTPYGAFTQSHYLDTPENNEPAFRSRQILRGGLDAKAVIHDSLTLDLTLNPDFSQVESDDPQVTVNQRYEVQFPEKRPFFLENNSYFLTPENLFFSRRVVDPEFGARLTGKVGRWNMGFLVMDDRAPGGTPNSTAIQNGNENHAVIGVARLQREFQEQSSIGILLTDRELEGGFNRVAAIDTRIKWSKNWLVSGQAMTSQTQTSDGTHSGGNAWNADLHGENREWIYDLTYIDRAEGFRADLGFIPRVNIRQAQQTLNRRFHPSSKKILSWGPILYLVGDYDHHNTLQDWTVRPEFHMELVGNTYFAAYYSQIFERFQNINFRRKDTGVGAHTEYWKHATFDLGYSQGTRINYDTGNGMPPFLGYGSEFQSTITIRPVSRLKLDEIYYLTRLYTLEQGVGGQDSRFVFVNHLARSRVNYQFTRELSLRVILDYNGVLQNPALINLPRQKTITGDVLLTYLLHPGTAVYLGYTDRLENLALFPGPPAEVGRIGFPSTTTGRQFFAKISYQFRF